MSATLTAARGHSIRVVRTATELAVLAAGWLLGGTVGPGTLVYALAIGPLAHQLIPALTVTGGAAGVTPHRLRRRRNRSGIEKRPSRSRT